MSDLSLIRNFCIIAHVDHGKSTLADRILQLTGQVADRDFRDQLLDDMDLERERGITIKAHPVTMKYKAEDGKTYTFNLIDTPGHVDFSYEVARSLSACEGAILVVDATQGVEAQTVANTHLAMDHDLALIPVLNKIDLQNANVDEVLMQLEEVLAMPRSEAYAISAKTGKGIEPVLEALVKVVPPPVSLEPAVTRALVFDSIYDPYRGVVVYLRVFDGAVKRGDRIRLMATGQDYEVKEVGLFAPDPLPMECLEAGGVGYLMANIKSAAEIKVGDTVTLAKAPAKEALPGFKEVHPAVFTGLYPLDTSDYDKLQRGLEKLRLNDSAFDYQQESSAALGFGFRCGFLGLLHMEIVQERLRREFDLDILGTYPSVIYRVCRTNGQVEEVDNPAHLPDATVIDRIEEPIIRAYIICHNEHIGDVMQLIMDRRGELEKTESLDTRRVILTCTLPLNEILVDFHDRLKSISHGYASMDYDPAGYRVDQLVKLEILVHGEPVEAFSCIIHRSKAASRGRQICKQLKEIVPPQQYAIALQAAVHKTVVARETIRAFRKDVIAKCYGGDVTRKRKLLENQKAGKKKMKQIGQVNIPQEAFIKVFKSH